MDGGGYKDGLARSARREAFGSGLAVVVGVAAAWGAGAIRAAGSGGVSFVVVGTVGRWICFGARGVADDRGPSCPFEAQSHRGAGAALFGCVVRRCTTLATLG